MLSAELLRPDQPFLVRQPRPDLDDAAFLDLCRRYPEWRFETDAGGTLTIMSPSGWRSANRNARLTAQLVAWADQDGTGEVTDSSGLFRLGGGARRAPDVAWTRKDRLGQVPRDAREGILPIVPDFVIELRSPSDRLEDLQQKMLEYVAHGVRLGWLIDPIERHTYEYRPGQAVQVRDEPAELHGDPELPGFILDLRPIW